MKNITPKKIDSGNGISVSTDHYKDEESGPPGKSPVNQKIIYIDNNRGKHGTIMVMDEKTWRKDLQKGLSEDLGIINHNISVQQKEKKHFQKENHKINKNWGYYLFKKYYNKIITKNKSNIKKLESNLITLKSTKKIAMQATICELTPKYFGKNKKIRYRSDAICLVSELMEEKLD